MQPLALVTADTAPFAAVTDASGVFIVGGRAGVSTNVTALEPAGGSASGAAAIAALNDVATLNLSMVQTAPAVTATIPAPNAVNVALATPIVVDSKAIDPATVTTSSVVLSAGPNLITTQLVMSANRRRLTMTPASPLAGLTAHTLTLTSAIRDSAGVPLAPFTPLTFTTLDPSKATILAVSVIVAELPDEDGLSLITGAPGAAEPNSAVVATNLRTQETVTVLALADGSFRLRLNVVIGDEIALTLRDASGREPRSQSRSSLVRMGRRRWVPERCRLPDDGAETPRNTPSAVRAPSSRAPPACTRVGWRHGSNHRAAPRDQAHSGR